MDYFKYSTVQLYNEIQASKSTFFEGAEGRIREKFAKQLSDYLIGMSATLGNGTSQLSKFCKAGCTHCCTHLFQLTVTEATAITYYLLHNDEALIKFIRNFKKNQRNYPNKAELREECTPKDREPTPEDFTKYFEHKIPCDFLVDDLCIIYETRPLICSAYISQAPARICALEPKASIPLEARKYFYDCIKWFEAQARRRYKKQPVSITNFSEKIIEELLTGNF